MLICKIEKYSKPGYGNCQVTAFNDHLILQRSKLSSLKSNRLHLKVR
jgi:hypothetical protein